MQGFQPLGHQLLKFFFADQALGPRQRPLCRFRFGIQAQGFLVIGMGKSDFTGIFVTGTRFQQLPDRLVVDVRVSLLKARADGL
jgi:hypothetical protein